MNPLDILCRTPKTNCGGCGFPTCLAFAAAVSRTGFDPTRCPHLDHDGLDLSGLPARENDHDLELIKHLKSKVSRLDLKTIAPELGAEYDEPGRTLSFTFLGRRMELDRSGITIAGREPDDPRDQILLYNYIHSGGGPAPAPALDWVGMETLPNSISKTKTLAVYGEDRLGQLFAPLSIADITKLAEEAGGRVEEQEGANAALIIPVLPRVPQKIIYWEECEEDGFPAKVKILFDRNVLSFLDLESLVFSAERMADRFNDLAGR